MNTLSAELKTEKKNEETEIYRVGGEGSSSCAHGVFDGTGHHELYGLRAALKRVGDGLFAHPSLYIYKVP